MVVRRLCKAVLVAVVAYFFKPVAFGNVTDFRSNWQFVQPVLSMDTTFPDSNLHWRAITDPALQAAAYQLIIAVQIVTAALLWAGAIRLLMAVRSMDFPRSKGLAIAGLTLGLLLYMVSFIAIDGEWFAMWKSRTWNGQQKAFEFVAVTGVVLIIILMPDGDTA